MKKMCQYDTSTWQISLSVIILLKSESLCVPLTHTKIISFPLFLLSLLSKEANMEDELVTKPLLVKQEPDNISSSNDLGDSSGAGAAVRPNDSSATVILVISTFVVACSIFTGGSVVSTITSIQNQ